MAAGQRTLQLHALFLICLLVGAECARIHTEASVVSHTKTLANSVQTRVEAAVRTDATRADLGQEVAVVESTISKGLGDDVCRLKDLKSPHGAVDRYKYKAETLLQLVAKIKSEKSTLRDLCEMLGRERKFNSCVVQVSDGKAMSPQQQELFAVMDGGKYSMTSIGHKTLSAAVAVGKQHGLFKTSGKCGFDLERIDLGAAQMSKRLSEPIDAIRAQLFGPECNGAAFEYYVSGVSLSEKKVIDKSIELLSLAAMGKDIQQIGNKLEEEIKQELSEADLDTVLGSDSDSNSLLELEMEPGLIAFLILLAVLFLCSAVTAFSN